MATFHKIELGTVVLYAKGVFKQADLYHYKGCVFAKHGGGFIRVKATGGTPKETNLGTSVPSVLVDEIELPYPLTFGTHGNVEHKE